MAFNDKEKEIISWGLQNGKSQQEVEQAISKYRMGAISQPQQPQTTDTTPSFAKRAKEAITKAGETIVDTMNSTEGSALKRGTEMTATAFNVIPQVAMEALPEPARKGLDFIGKQLGRGFELLTDKLASTKLLSEVASLEQQGFINKEQNPTLYKVLDTLGTASAGGQIAGDILLADQSTKALQKGADITKTGVNKVKQGITDTTKEFKADLSQTGTQISNKLSTTPNSIMNKVARVTPKEAQTFKNMTGKDIGTYLTEKGNFNSPAKIVTTEAETFAKTLADKEATLAKLPGTYKSGIVDDTLQALKNRALETSSPNVKAPYLQQVDNWITKAKTTGLTMEEINNAKKLFEREVKLGYNKLTDAPKIKQATYLDDALRTFQDETASKLGFTNIKDLSKQIQASKFIVDKLGNKLVSNDLLNGVSLTDYIILAGGEPSSVGAFLTKKLFSNKAIQAKIAKILSSGETMPEVKANYSPQATQVMQPKNIKINTNPISKTIPKTTKKASKKSTGLKGKGTIPENSLISEAKKYKSAEEFVKAQPKTATGAKVPDTLKSFSLEDKDLGQIYRQSGIKSSAYPADFIAKNDIPELKIKKGDRVSILANDKDARRFTIENIPERKTEFGTYSKSAQIGDLVDGYSRQDQIDFINKNFSKEGLTKSQLTDIWNKANKK